MGSAFMVVAADEDIRTQLQEAAEGVNGALAACLSKCAGVSPRLVEAMRYSLESGGKRLRPALVLWSCELCGGEQAVAVPAAVAVECIHTFSLIHDDLPAIDDDDTRRGRPSNHTVFGEAMAILAGDGLLALAFEILARDIREPALAAAMVREVAVATGTQGMIGGECADVEGESAEPDAALVRRIHAAKTGCLIAVSCRLGAMAARAGDEEIAALDAYGRSLGLAFQEADDLLDATGDAASAGKPVGKDAGAGKQTYVRIVGIDEARRMAVAAADEAVASLAPFGPRASRLAALARYVVERPS
jgi:geranylgeranyl pyrophosphate synthase